uniref:Myb/SANT-like DNA-binding domain-containing protein n=1 Tax=Bactrocera latifrons TaxID=174628 RepID=A0A0K8UZG6_BACLA
MAHSETKFQSFKWTKNPTLLLISLINKKYHQLKSGVKKFTFQQIAQEINNRLGTCLAYDQVESKWKGLRRTYIKMKDSEEKLSWEFYNQIHEILKDDMEINPSVTANSDDVFTTGCETEFDFVEYTIEPESSTFRQTRKRHHSDSDDKYSSAEDVKAGVRNISRFSIESRKDKVIRNKYDKEDSDARTRPRIADHRYKKEYGSRRISDDDRNYCKCRGYQRSHSCCESVEDARERRHQEKMKMAKKFLSIFEKMVERM